MRITTEFRPLARSLVPGLLAALLLQAAFSGTAAAATPRKFEAKACVECHEAFAEVVLQQKVLHPGVKDNTCETCHIRHGLVGKLILQKDGNALCLGCHSKESIGLDQPKVHSALTRN